MDDADMMRELVAALIDDTVQQIGLLEVAVRGGDSKECIRLAHYSKGACANLGAVSAAALLKRIETTALASQFGECSASLTALQQEVELLREEAATL